MSLPVESLADKAHPVSSFVQRLPGIVFRRSGFSRVLFYNVMKVTTSKHLNCGHTFISFHFIDLVMHHIRSSMLIFSHGRKKCANILEFVSQKRRRYGSPMVVPGLSRNTTISSTASPRMRTVAFRHQYVVVFVYVVSQ